jgi:hypothetical protein
MSNAKITSLTALTTPADADVFPIVDVSDTTMAATGTTKKITVSSFFPASSTDNAIARFDGITGKVIQDSALTISDLTTFTRIKPVVKSGAGSSFLVQGGDSSDDVGGSGRVIGGDALSGDKAGGYAITLGGAGIGSGAGGSGTVQGGTAGATGAGGAAVVQGGAGGATSGDGGLATVYGGNATASDSNGGSIVIAPGNKSGSGINGLIALKESRGATYAGYLQLSSIASSDKVFTFPNQSGTFALRGQNTFTGAQAFDVNSDGGAGDGNFHIDADTGGICRLQVYTPGTYAQHPLHLQALRILLRSTAGVITANGAINYAADAGSSDTYAITLDPAPSDYYTGMQVIFKANTANTGAATLNVNSLGAKTIVKAVSTALANNDILANMFCLCIYDGTNFVLMNPRTL